LEQSGSLGGQKRGVSRICPDVAIDTIRICIQIEEYILTFPRFAHIYDWWGHCWTMHNI
jgi:hypothetical protein